MSAILISAGWPIWPLLIISIFGLAILLERLWFLRRSKIARVQVSIWRSRLEAQ